MNQTVNIDVRVDHKSINQLEDELSAVNQQLKNISTSDPKFDEYAMQAQALTKELDKANTAAEGFTSEKKFQAADGAIKVMAGSLSGVVGALGLIGVESEVFGEMEQKAASAIAVAMGVKDVSEGFNQVRQAVTGLIPKIASLNATMLLNPYVLIAAGIAAVGVAIYAMTQYTTEAEQEMEELNDEIERQRGLLDGTVESYLALEQLELKRAVKAKEDLQTLMASNAEKGIRFNKDKETLKLLDEEIQKRTANVAVYKESIQATKDYNKERIDEVVLLEREIALMGDDKVGKMKKQIELLKVQKEQTDDYAQQQRYLTQIKVLEQQIADQRAADDLKEREKTAEEKVAEFVKELELLDEIKAAREAMLNPDAGPEEPTFDSYDAALEDEEDTELEDTLEKNKKLVEAEKAKNQMIIASKQNLLSNVAAIAGAESKIGKAAFIAQQILNAKALIGEIQKTITFSTLAASRSTVAVAEGTAQTAKVGFPQNIPLLIGYAAQAAGIIGAIRGAVKGAKGSNAGVNVPQIPVNGPRGGQVDINPDQVQQLTASNEQSKRAYVVSGDVRSNQEAEAKIQNRRTLD